MKSLYESLLDDEDEVMNRVGSIGRIELIKQFIKENYNCYDKWDLFEFITTGKENIVNFSDCLYLNPDAPALTDGTFRFGKVKMFYIKKNSNIENLNGAPRECENFWVDSCPNIKSIKGAPEKTAKFSLSNLDNLTDIKDIPEISGFLASFAISDCPKIKSIKLSIPQLQDTDIRIELMNGLESIKDLEVAQCRFLYVENCKKLKSLECKIKEVTSLRCDGCTSLTSLAGAPRGSDPRFYTMHCDETGLVDMHGCPDNATEIFCKKCKNLVTMDGISPALKSLTCSYCTSLEDISAVPSHCKISSGGCRKLK